MLGSSWKESKHVRDGAGLCPWWVFRLSNSLLDLQLLPPGLHNRPALLLERIAIAWNSWLTRFFTSRSVPTRSPSLRGGFWADWQRDRKTQERKHTGPPSSFGPSRKCTENSIDTGFSPHPDGRTPDEGWLTDFGTVGRSLLVGLGNAPVVATRPRLQ